MRTASHGPSDLADFFGGYLCLCGEASWNSYHEAEVETGQKP